MASLTFSEVQIWISICTDYALDWSARLSGDDRIVTSSWIAPDGITADQSSHSDTLAIVWLSGGTIGKSYDIVNRVVTANGRHFDQSVRIRIKSK